MRPGRGLSGAVVRRSWLLVPVSDERQVAEASSSGADVAVLDLVEFVPEKDKPRARVLVKEAIASVSRGGAEVFVQVEPDLLHADLHASVWPGLSGVVISRLESPREVEEAAGILSLLEDERGLLPGTVQIVASLETASGNQASMEIARSSARLWGLTLGRADLIMDLRPEPSGEIHLMTYLMQRLVLVANAAGLVPFGAWWRHPARGLLAEPDDTYQAAMRGRHIGFKGSLCVRPNQVEPLNRGFSPDAGEIALAQSLVESFSWDGEAQDMLVNVDGLIVDLPAAKGALQQIEWAKACDTRDQEKAKAMAQGSSRGAHNEGAL